MEIYCQGCGNKIQHKSDCVEVRYGKCDEFSHFSKVHIKTEKCRDFFHAKCDKAFRENGI